MPTSAGFQLLAGRIPGELIASSSVTADSANFTTTETVVMTVTAPVVTGRTYSIWGFPSFQSSVADDFVRAAIRQDNASGTRMDLSDIAILTTTGTIWTASLFALYTADATEEKTFVVTGDRIGGTGDCRLEADAQWPAIMLVRYETG